MNRLHVYIFRHGQTDMNLADQWQGSGSDCLLNQVGEEQARHLGEKVKDKNIKKLYCSPLLRAVQTAIEVAKSSIFKPQIVILPDLRECNFGDVEGKSFDEVRRQYGSFVDVFLNPTKETWGKKFPHGESKQEVFVRVMNALMNIVMKERNTVGVVCHAAVISSLACGLGLTDVSYDNCAILHLAYDFEKHMFIHVK